MSSSLHNGQGCTGLRRLVLTNADYRLLSISITSFASFRASTISLSLIS